MDCIVIFLDYFPVMPSRPITPHVAATSVYGERFRQKKSYTNWRPRGGSDWLLIYTEAGSGRIRAEASETCTAPGDLLLYEPGIPQDYATAPQPGHWQLLWAHFHPRAEWRPRMEWPLMTPGVRLVKIPDEFRSDFVDAMTRMIRHCRRKTSDLAMNAMEEALLWGHESAARSQEPPVDERIRRARQILTEDFKKPFSLSDLAQRCGLSVSRFSHLFQQTGQTPQQFLEQQRLAHGRQLLQRTNLSIEHIAADCGYEDPFYFTKRFTRSQGQSPRCFRALSQA